MSIKGFIKRKLNPKRPAVFLGTHSFTEEWGNIKAAEIVKCITRNIPPQKFWTEQPREIKAHISKAGIRLDSVDGLPIETDGPIAWVPRMMAAVANIEELAIRDRGRKNPCVAVLSYNAIHLADGQVPQKDQKVEFFVSLLRFRSEKSCSAFSAAAIKLWEPLKSARQKRLKQGLPDAVMESGGRRLSVDSVSFEPSSGGDAGDADDLDIDKIEEEVSEVGYLDVQGFGMSGG